MSALHLKYLWRRAEKRFLFLLTMLRSLPAIKDLRRPHIICQHLTSQEQTFHSLGMAVIVSLHAKQGLATLQGQKEGSVHQYSHKTAPNPCENTVEHISYWCGLPWFKHWCKSLQWQIYTRNELLKLHQWLSSGQTRLRQTGVPVGWLLPTCD